MDNIKIKIETVTVTGPDRSAFPYVIKHDIDWNHPNWKKMHRWCKKNIGEYQKEYTWFLTSEWCFRTQEQALTFAVVWGG